MLLWKDALVAPVKQTITNNLITKLYSWYVFSTLTLFSWIINLFFNVQMINSTCWPINKMVKHHSKLYIYRKFVMHSNLWVIRFLEYKINYAGRFNRNYLTSQWNSNNIVKPISLVLLYIIQISRFPTNLQVPSRTLPGVSIL